MIGRKTETGQRYHPLFALPFNCDWGDLLE
jgi:hypothetical protein